MNNNTTELLEDFSKYLMTHMTGLAWATGNPTTVVNDYLKSKVKKEEPKPEWESIGHVTTWKYHQSVKRIYDGTVFSPGDYVIYLGQSFPPTKIICIKESQDGKIVFEVSEFSCVGLNDKNVKKVENKETNDKGQSKEEPKHIEVQGTLSNIETFNMGYSMGYKDGQKYNQQVYTKNDLLEAKQKAFYAGKSYAHPTFYDYYETLKDNK